MPVWVDDGSAVVDSPCIVDSLTILPLIFALLWTATFSGETTRARLSARARRGFHRGTKNCNVILKSAALERDNAAIALLSSKVSDLGFADPAIDLTACVRSSSCQRSFAFFVSNLKHFSCFRTVGESCTLFSLTAPSLRALQAEMLPPIVPTLSSKPGLGVRPTVASMLS